MSSEPTEPLVLVVDDQADIREPLAAFLRRSGFAVRAAASTAAARARLRDAAAPVDLVVLDVGLPGEDGLVLCRELRARGGPPVVLLTARAAVADRIAGLEQGADDYVVKPFDPDELVARVRSVLRRVRGAPAGAPRVRRYRFAGWVFDVDQQELRNGCRERVPLSAAEARLLAVLASRPREVLSRDRLLDLTRGGACLAYDRSIDTQVSRLRRKLEPDARRPTLLKTAWGNGYLLAADVRCE